MGKINIDEIATWALESNPELASNFWGNSANQGSLVIQMIEKSNYKISDRKKCLDALKKVMNRIESK